MCVCVCVCVCVCAHARAHTHTHNTFSLFIVVNEDHLINLMTKEGIHEYADG